MSFKPVIVALATFVAANLATEGGAYAQTASDLACRGCVGAKDLGRKAVTKKAIRKNAVDSAKIRNGSIKPEDLSAPARPSGVDGETAGEIPLGTTSESIVSTTVSAPVAGLVLVTATWFYAGAAGATARCHLSTEAGGTADGSFSYAHSDGIADYVDNAALTYVFNVPAGDTTFHLNCYYSSVQMYVVAPSIAAIFTPNRY